ncbi:MAG: UbiA family prenyltransferase [Candidatus Methanoperedens sp.]|nr:UbiA family prenyltransferase [Candidatus Methanoperedens sp.]
MISTSLFLATGGFFKVIFSGLLYNTFASYNAIITFLITFGVYGLNKLTDIKEDAINTPERANIIGKIQSKFKFFVAISFILSLLLGFIENILTLPVLIFPLFLGTLYSVKLSNNLPRLKDITGVKNLTIALSWAVVTAFLPVIFISEKKIILILLIFWFFFLKSYINSILFDVRDIQGDIINKVRTVPVFLGITRTKNLLLALNSIYIPWLIFSYSQGFFRRYLFIFFFAIAYGYWYILYFCKERKKIGKSLDLLVDGEFIGIAIMAPFILIK